MFASDNISNYFENPDFGTFSVFFIFDLYFCTNVLDIMMKGQGRTLSLPANILRYLEL